MAGYLVENLTDPKTAHSQEPNHSPAQRALDTDLPLHYWLQEPENALALARCQHSMRSLTGYASEDLPDGGEGGKYILSYRWIELFFQFHRL